MAEVMEVPPLSPLGKHRLSLLIADAILTFIGGAFFSPPQDTLRSISVFSDCAFPLFFIKTLSLVSVFPFLAAGHPPYSFDGDEAPLFPLFFLSSSLKMEERFSLLRFCYLFRHLEGFFPRNGSWKDRLFHIPL